MSEQNKKFTLDIAKIVAALTMFAGGIYWAGKIDQKVTDIKEDVTVIKQYVYPPPMHQEIKSVSPLKTASK